MVRIAVDGMGGDFAPQAIVQGAVMASRENIADVVVVGNEQAIRPYINDGDRIEVVHTPVWVDMDESPSNALRRKKDSSINRAFELLKARDVDAVVTAGNSGAAMAFAIFTLGRLRSIDRPAIATLHPNKIDTISIMVDAGGTVDCKPNHLVQFAIMGDAFARSALGIASPKVGILSNGEEVKKGNELTRETHALLQESNLHYIGYVEGNDIYNGNADVIVCDGFVGNVALKSSEGAAEALIHTFRSMIQKSSIKGRLGYILLKDVFDNLSKKMDFSEIGGAPLLGVDGVCIICHGKSGPKAIRSAIAQAKRFVDKNLKDTIKESLAGYRSGEKGKEG